MWMPGAGTGSEASPCPHSTAWPGGPPDKPDPARHPGSVCPPGGGASPGSPAVGRRKGRVGADVGAPGLRGLSRGKACGPG